MAVLSLSLLGSLPFLKTKKVAGQLEFASKVFVSAVVPTKEMEKTTIRKPKLVAIVWRLAKTHEFFHKTKLTKPNATK